MTEESLSEKEKDFEDLGDKFITGVGKYYKKEDVKEKIQNAQRRLKEELSKLNRMGTHTIFMRDGVIDKIFLEEFGDKLLK